MGQQRPERGVSLLDDDARHLFGQMPFELGGHEVGAGARTLDVPGVPGTRQERHLVGAGLVHGRDAADGDRGVAVNPPAHERADLGERHRARGIG